VNKIHETREGKPNLAIISRGALKLTDLLF
jgi:hypothetical protein